MKIYTLIRYSTTAKYEFLCYSKKEKGRKLFKKDVIKSVEHFTSLEAAQEQLSKYYQEDLTLFEKPCDIVFRTHAKNYYQLCKTNIHGEPVIDKSCIIVETEINI